MNKSVNVFLIQQNTTFLCCAPLWCCYGLANVWSFKKKWFSSVIQNIFSIPFYYYL